MIEQRKIDVATQLFAVAALLTVLKLGLLPGLLAGLLVHQLVHSALPRLRGLGVPDPAGKAVVLALFAVLVLALIALTVLGLKSLLVGRNESLGALLQRMAEIIDTARTLLPPSVQDYLPADAEALQRTAAQWLRTHAAELQQAGTSFGRSLTRIFFGMIIGGLIAVGDSRRAAPQRPLARSLGERAEMLARAFRRVVFAQAQISAVNTTLTALYLAGILPLFGVHLPFLKTLIVLTFVVGLLPIIGNLVSNTVIIVISLSISLYVAIASLLFLVLIHKLEYFVNARLMGRHLGARAWELLLAMLVMDAAFGLPGLVAAPIYYGYVKDELSARELV